MIIIRKIIIIFDHYYNSYNFIIIKKIVVSNFYFEKKILFINLYEKKYFKDGV